ncbi:MAG: hypothetical protein COW03_09150 [Cytophagales bacterium CG12_big_fil_rev_8_21_14_0_65_40_12]|nr:MAG: hypothetical protein COW03_09150 [Cytophagales bacterium CG12_big_fil_rev_8_21_14_0_65_40_12]PIW03564.1 MAG: hypothetical protein COW40_14295 [Cytophagales bacterium CG17_big_fil_post_rev_8_21_14_2_50_40_13]
MIFIFFKIWFDCQIKLNHKQVQRPIRIGVLCPYSSIYPNLSSDFTDGLLSGIQADYHKHVQLIPEYVGQGGRQPIMESFNKLLSFHRVDIVSGFASYRLIPDLVPAIESRNILGLFADMGEYIPYTHHISDNVFFSSFQFWQAEYALGFWAQKNFEGKGHVLLSLYEAGYQMHYAFREGYFMAGGKEIDISVLPQNRPSRALMAEYFEDFMEKFRKEKPSFIHALFSGYEAVDFISLYYEKGLHKEVPLIVSPHMASEEVLTAVNGVNAQIYGASIWSREEDNHANRKFKEAVLRQSGLLTNTPTLQGYEIGLALTGVFKQLLKRDISEVSKILKEQRITTPRGERSFYLDSDYATPNITIEKLLLEGSIFKRLAIEEGRSLNYNDEVFGRIHKENISGWINPYLCV